MEAGQGPAQDRAAGATPKTSLSCRTSSTSRINTECISHHWTIENFSKCQFFQSGTFFSEEFPKDSSLVRLKLRLDLTKDYASICVVPFHGMQGRNCVYTLTLLGEAGRPVQRYFHNGFHTLYRGSTNYLGIELCKAFLYNRENKCIHGDALSILFEVEFLADSTNTPIKRTDIPVSPLLKNLAGLLEDKSFGNVQLTVQQRNLYAHRDVLMLSSPVFGAMFSHPTKESQEQVRLKLRLDLTKDYASICVVPFHGMQGRNCVYTLTLLGEAGRPVQRYFHNGFHTLYRGSTNYLGIELCKAFLYNRENKCIHGDALSILFEVEFLADSTNTPIKRTDIPVSPLLKNLAGLLEDKSFGNVQLTVQQRNLYAHRDVLMLSSPVFGAMFSHPTKESQEQVIHLPDQSFDAMREMLLFIYTGEVPNLDKVAEDLYVAADKYSMSELKTLCGDYLGSNLTVERAADAFVLSNMYSDAELSRSIARFIADHLVAVQRTAGWKNIWGKPDITERLFMLIADIGNTLESAT